MRVSGPSRPGALRLPIRRIGRSLKLRRLEFALNRYWTLRRKLYFIRRHFVESKGNFCALLENTSNTIPPLSIGHGQRSDATSGIYLSSGRRTWHATLRARFVDGVLSTRPMSVRIFERTKQMARKRTPQLETRTLDVLSRSSPARGRCVDVPLPSPVVRRTPKQFLNPTSCEPGERCPLEAGPGPNAAIRVAAVCACVSFLARSVSASVFQGCSATGGTG
jgi:hypothetical protein